MGTQGVYALIMAGGSGKRFWPKSTRSVPKQLLKLFGEKTLLEEALRRVSPFIPPANVYLGINQRIEEVIRELIKELPSDNFIIEPESKNTAPAIGLAASYISVKHGEDAVMCVLTADHIIKNEPVFLDTLKFAVEIASKEEVIVTLGINPTSPHTGYGYIHRGEERVRRGQLKAYKVKQFREKPSLEQAKAFLKTGEYYWNSGMFIFKCKKILTSLKLYLPELYQGLCQIKEKFNTPEEARVKKEVFSKLTSISIDYGVIEKEQEIYVIGVELGWQDVGSWSILEEVYPRDEKGNVVRGEFQGIDTHNCIIYNEQGLVASLGVQDLMIIKAKDVVLVASKERSQEVKTLVELLEKDTNLRKYL
jgi:mannose-1-phosphate guanylyltransferase